MDGLPGSNGIVFVEPPSFPGGASIGTSGNDFVSEVIRKSRLQSIPPATRMSNSVRTCSGPQTNGVESAATVYRIRETLITLYVHMFQNRSKIISLCIALITTAKVHPQVATSWNGGNGNWSTASQWSPATFAPINGNGGNTYNVNIGSGTVTLDVPVTIQALTLSGQIAGSQSLTINGLFTWTDGGSLNGPGTVTANGGVVVNGSAPPFLATNFINNGSAFIGRNLYGATGAIWNNSLGAVVEIGGNSGFCAFSGIPVINNSGTVQKTLGVPDSTIGWQFNNAATGIVNVQTGILALSGGGTWASGASIAIGSTAKLQFSAGTFTFGNTNVANDGTLEFSLIDGVTVNGTFTTTGSGFTGINRSVTLNGTSTLGKVGVYGTWGGSGNVAIGDLLTISGGALTGTGTTTANAGIKIANAQIDSATISRTIINNGTATFEGDGDLTGTATGLWTNSPGSLFDVRISRNINGSGGTPVFNNSGTFQKSIANGTTFVGWQMNNLAGATVQTLTGLISLSGGGTISSGSFLAAASGTTLGLDSAFTVQPGTSFTGPGTLRLGGTITVSTGTLTLAGPVSLNGTLTGPGNVVFNGQFNLTNGGQINSAGTVTANGLMVTEGTPTPVGLNATLTTNGNTTFGGTTYGNALAVWNNSAGASLDFINDSGLPVNAGVPVFNNAGTVKKSAVFGNFTAVNWQFNTLSTATVSVLAGPLAFGGGGTWATGTTVTTAATTSLTFNGGAFTLGTLAVTNAGTIKFAATETATSSFTIPGVSEINSGTLTLNGTSSFGSVTQFGGTWDGTGNVAISGQFTWSGGNLTGSGITTANGGVILGSANVNIGRPFVNTGTATMSGTAKLIALTGAAWNNAAGSTFDIQNSNSLQVSGGATVPTFTNDGLLKKTSNNTSINIDWTLDQSATGVFNLLLGTITMTAGGTFASGSSTSVSSGTTLHFSGGTFSLAAGSSLSSAGLLRFGGGSAATTIAGTFTQTGTTDILGGTTTFNGNAVAFVAVNESAGTWKGSSNITMSGLFAWSGGTIGTGGGTTTANGGVTISGAATLARGFTNNGTTTLTSTGGLTGNPGATWSNPVSSLFNISGNGGIALTAGLPKPAFTNVGTFRKSAGTGTSTIAWDFTNSGNIQAQTGTLTFSSGVTNTGTVTVSSGATVGGTITTNSGGTVNGGGTLSGTAIINTGGSIAPGTATAIDTLTVATSTITSGGIYLWKVQNAGPNGTFAAINNTATSSTGSGVQDALTVTGNLNWASPKISIVGLTGNGFDNTKAYSWRLGTYGGTGSITSPTFLTTNFPAFSGNVFTVSTISNTIVLNYNPISEPSVLILAFVLCFLGALPPVARHAVIQ
ncbi:hypothetical protein BH11PLA2_BH11PLA2_25410 [soil metagenome]